MKKIVLTFFASLLTMSVTEAQNIYLATELGIVPRPKSIMRVQGDDYRIHHESIVYSDEKGQSIADYLSKFISKSTGFDLVSKPLEKDKDKGILLVVNSDLNTTAEGYMLSSSKDQVKIIGKSPAGLFYGVQTLFQLLPPQIYSSEIQTDLELKVPAVKILDEPLFKRFRGLHVDVSRHFRTKEEMFEIVDYLTMHKMNTMHMHLTDDEGWRMEIKTYPKLTEVGAIGQRGSEGKGEAHFFTQTDLKEIIYYANTRYIQVFPEIDMPGHMMGAIKAYPYLKSPYDLRKSARVIRNDKEGLDFCRNVLKEVREVFGMVPIHIGFDEINLDSEQQIYSDTKITAFAKILTTYVKKDLGVIPIIWDDAFEKGLHDEEVFVQWWRPGKMHWWSHLELTVDQKLQKLNQPYILSPANWTYFDMKNAEGYQGQDWAGIVSVDKVYNWEPFRDLVDSDASKRHLAQGIIGCTWSEYIPDFSTFQERLFPRIAALAEKAWAQSIEEDPNKPNWQIWRDEVLIKKQIPRYDAMKLNYWSKDKPEDLLNVKEGKIIKQ